FHPVTGELWASEHGPRGGDELNWIQPGHNYGWPVATYGINYDGTPVSDKTEMEGMDGPVVQWTPSLAVCGMAFYTGERLPGWKNDLFLGGLVGQQLRRLVVEGHKVVHEELLFRKLGRVRAVVNGPGGYLYRALNPPGEVGRLVPAPGGSGGDALQHADDRAAAGRERVLDLVHELAHEEDAAAVGLQQVLGSERVRHHAGIEALALIAHLDLERAILPRAADAKPIRLVL